MRSLDTLRGYATIFNEISAELEDGLREIIKPGAFLLLNHPITATVEHGGALSRIATTWDLSLRLWQDRHGLAIEMDVPATPLGAGLRDMVAGGINAMSIGLEILQAKITDNVRTVSRADIDHCSIVDRGAYAGACCWLASAPAATPTIAAATRRWGLGKIIHEQKVAANHAMLAGYKRSHVDSTIDRGEAQARRSPGPILLNTARGSSSYDRVLAMIQRGMVDPPIMKKPRAAAA